MSFETWEDARPVRLEFGDGAKRRVVRSEGADYHESEEAHDWVAVSLMPLCRQDEYGVDGLLVRKGVHTDCVRPGNGQKVMLQLSPAANSRPIIICKLYPPPTPPPPSPSPLPGPPPQRPPAPPPRVMTVSALSGCMLGGQASIGTERTDEVGLAVSRVQVIPDIWLTGYVVEIGVVGSSLDVSDVVRAMGLSTTEATDPSGGRVFRFVLGPDEPDQKTILAFVLHGTNMELASFDCWMPSPLSPPPTQPAAWIDDSIWVNTRAAIDDESENDLEDDFDDADGDDGDDTYDYLTYDDPSYDISYDGSYDLSAAAQPFADPESPSLLPSPESELDAGYITRLLPESVKSQGLQHYLTSPVYVTAITGAVIFMLILVRTLLCGAAQKTNSANGQIPITISPPQTHSASSGRSTRGKRRSREAKQKDKGRTGYRTVEDPASTGSESESDEEKGVDTGAALDQENRTGSRDNESGRGNGSGSGSEPHSHSDSSSRHKSRR